MVSLQKVGYRNFMTLVNILTKNVVDHEKTQRLLFHCSSLLHAKGQEIKMPSLSPTMVEGKIVKWLKKEGDAINPGDVICDIETDKAVVSMEVEEEGIMAKILVPSNSGQVKVGSVIALMVGEDEDWRNVEAPVQAAGDSSDSGSCSSSSTSSDDESNSGPTGMPVTMPSLSPTMTAGTIVKWVKKEGSTVSPGDVLCEIQTDKAVMSLETEEEGILAKILVPEDSGEVKVGTVIALMVDADQDWKNVRLGGGEPEKVQAQPQTATSGVNAGNERRSKTFGPAVKSMLDIYQIDPGLVKPTGKGNRILKEDVLNYIKDHKLEKKPPKPVASPGASATGDKPGAVSPLPQPSAGARKSQMDSPSSATSTGPNYVDIEVSNMRQIIADRLLQSKVGIPHSYSMAKCNASSMLDVRTSLAEEGHRVSVNDLITKATAMALKIYPKANALCVNNQVKLSESVDICVAVATDRGLFTPIVKSTNEKSVVAISEEIRDLAGKAKSGKLKPEEYAGGTFTISNLGMFGVTHFKAIINPPQCGILAVGDAVEEFDASMKVQKYLTLSLSYDRRALEEDEAAEFMETLKYVIENPKLIMPGYLRSSARSL